MPFSMKCRGTLLLLGLSLAGCGVYDKYGHGRVAASRLDAESATAITLPANAPSISQRFLPQGVSSKSEHKGFDILVPSGTPVLAAAAGRVSGVQTSILYGRQVMIDHAATGSGERIQTRYFHLSERLVAAGDPVRRGQVVGYSGQSGMTGVYPHLHFEVHRLSQAEPPVATRFLDPQLFWVEGAGRISCYDSGREWAEHPVALTYPVPCRGVEWK